MARKHSEPSNDHLRVKSDDDKRAVRNRKRPGERIRDDDNDKSRRRATVDENSEPSDQSEEDKRTNRDKGGGRDRSNRHDIGHRDRRNDRRLESENDRHRNRDRRCRSRHDSDDDQEEDHRRSDDRRPESRNDRNRHRDHSRRARHDSDDDDDEKRKGRSNRNTEGENRSDDRRPESENDRYGNSDQSRHSRHVSDDGDEDHGRRSGRSTEGKNGSDRRDNNNQPSSRNRDDNSFKEKVKGEIKQKQSAPQETNLNGDTANLGRSGGIYIPPFKLARMMKETQDKSSDEYQRLTWDALRKSISGLVNEVNATNIKNIVPELFAENLIRGRGLFCRSCMKSQMASPSFTDVFAALVTVVNTKFPKVGDLLLRRIVFQLKRAYKRNDKPQLSAAVKFIAHLVNQQVAHEIIALELLTVLLEYPTLDSVEVAVGFVTECGSLLQDLSPKCLHGIFELFRGILHEGEIDKRVQFLIEGLFAIRKAKFQGYPAVCPELDLVEEDDQLTHEISLQDEIDPEITLDIFKPDPQYLENEKRYEELKKSIPGEESEDEEGSDAGSSDEEEEEDECDEEDEEQMKIKDETRDKSCKSSEDNLSDNHVQCRF
ncbi:hypothetical protein Goari_002620 [Gossypium aridum]|uniref:MIF4G domain-containing protein n=1 Tax=Gossypium aridum TaxID=34290 RepID=A0A7J8Y903_GOSAI|nr:hypothetical protein [Gossypium aridum]